MDRSRHWTDEVEGHTECAKSDAAMGYRNWDCFSAPQSAEKAAKAVFQKLGAEARGTFGSPLALGTITESPDFRRAYGWSFRT